MCLQGRINHCAGCAMGGGPRHQGAPDQLSNFYHALFWRLNVRCRKHKFHGWNITTTKKVVWEKGPPLTLVCPPECLIRPCVSVIKLRRTFVVEWYSQRLRYWRWSAVKLKFHWDQFPRNFPVANVMGKSPTSYEEVTRKLATFRPSRHVKMVKLWGNWSQ